VIKERNQPHCHLTKVVLHTGINLLLMQEKRNDSCLVGYRVFFLSIFRYLRFLLLPMKHLQITILINCALVFLLSSFCALVMATEYFQNEVTFTSIDKFDSNGLVGEPQKVLVPATFRRPLGEGKFPAIVIANSSAGTDDMVSAKLLADLPKHGYAALAIQSFKARGIMGDISRIQYSVSFQGSAVDSLYALDYLKSRDDIDPERICVMGHSRGGHTSFNFDYFKYFHDLAGYKGQPFACNVSIISGAFHRPKDDTSTTKKPALIIMGELDDSWHNDVNIEWYQRLIDRGENLKIVTIKGSHHLLTSFGKFIGSSTSIRGCKTPTIYSEEGSLIQGMKLNGPEAWSKCGKWGYTSWAVGGESGMDKYPEVLKAILEFLKLNIEK
jgi:dienelactone hydrolase